MNGVKIFFCLTLLGSASANAQTIRTLTLDEAIHEVLSASPQVKQSEFQINAAEARVNSTKSGDYPEADARFSYARVSPVSSMAFGLSLFQLNPANNYDGHIDLNAVVYDFQKRSLAKDKSLTGVVSAQDRLELTRQTLSYQTAKLFYSILFIEKSIQVHNEEVRTLQEHLEMTKKKIESGTATDFDVLTIQVRIAAALNKGIDLANALQRAVIQLKESAHIPGEDSIRLIGSFDSISVPSPDSSLVQQAFASRVELKAADNAIAAASIQKNLAALGNYPALNFHFAYGVKNGLFPNIDAWRGNYVAALELSVPLFNGFKEEYQIDEADAEINSVEEQKNFMIQQIQTEVRQALSTVQSNKEKVRIAQFTIEQAQKALAIARIRYSAGTITNLDLLDAETSLAEAQFQKVQALYTEVLSTVELDQASGKNLR